MTVFCILCLLLGLGLVGFGAYYAHQWYTDGGVAIVVLGIFMLAISIPLTAYNINIETRVKALVESGKYEIVTNEDYSLKELEQFMNVGGVYLKEVEE